MNKEALEKGVKFIQSYHERHKNDVIDIVLEFLMLALNIFTPAFRAYIVEFEQVNAFWGLHSNVG